MGESIRKTSRNLRIGRNFNGFLKSGFFNKKPKNKIIIFAIAAVLLLILVNFAVKAYPVLFVKTIYNGVSIHGINVSNLSEEQASIAVSKALESTWYNKIILLEYNGMSFPLKFKDFSFTFQINEAVHEAFMTGRKGGLFDKMAAVSSLKENPVNIKLSFNYDKNKLYAIIDSIRVRIEQSVADAEINYQNGHITYKKEIIGKYLNIYENIDKIINKISEINKINENDFDKIQLDVEIIKPHIIYDEIKGIKVMLDSFSTQFNTENNDRLHNIKLACERINNTIILPGEIFSMDKALGPRTIENGFKNSTVIYMNEYVEGIGGGVCQVTTTLYNAVLKTMLDVVERTHHTLVLGYVNPGQDATIAEGYIDFKFRNNKDYAICINAEVAGNSVVVGILGKIEKEQYTVKLESKIVSEIPPDGEEIVIDNSLKDGEKKYIRSAKNGVKAIVYRYLYNAKGQLVFREKISEDVYKPIKAQVKMNSKTAKIFIY